MSSAKPARRAILLSEVAALAAVLTFGLWPRPEAPTVRWNLDGEEPQHYGRIPAHTPMSLSLELDAPGHVYIVRHDPIDGTSALYPSAFLRSDLATNPLTPGRHEFPGRAAAGQELAWDSGSVTTPLTLWVLVADHPLTELEAVLATCRQIGNAAFPNRPMLGGYAPASGMDAVPPRHRIVHPVLEAALRAVDPDADGPLRPLADHPGVWAKTLHLQAEGTGPQSEEQLKAELQEMFGGAAPIPGK